MCCAGFVPSMLNMGMDDGHLFLKFYCHELELQFQCSRQDEPDCLGNFPGWAVFQDSGNCFSSQMQQEATPQRRQDAAPRF